MAFQYGCKSNDFTLVTLDILCFSMYLMITDWAMLTEHLLLSSISYIRSFLLLSGKGLNFASKWIAVQGPLSIL